MPIGCAFEVGVCGGGVCVVWSKTKKEVDEKKKKKKIGSIAPGWA